MVFLFRSILLNMVRGNFCPLAVTKRLSLRFYVSYVRGSQLKVEISSMSVVPSFPFPPDRVISRFELAVNLVYTSRKQEVTVSFIEETNETHSTYDMPTRH